MHVMHVMHVLQECAVTEGLQSCVCICDSGKGDLRDCVLASSGLDGVAAYHTGTEVDARNCKMVWHTSVPCLPASVVSWILTLTPRMPCICMPCICISCMCF
jgi:hypothetical protein